MRRSRGFVLGGAGVALVAFFGWKFLWVVNPLTISAQEIRRVEVQSEPWGETQKPFEDRATEDPEVIAALVALIRVAEQASEHKCGSRGVITLRLPDGRSAELRFLPGHQSEWYEFRTRGAIFRVPRPDFVAVMQRMGVEPPLEAQ